MSTYKDIERQENCNVMREVRSYKAIPESLSNKKKRCSKDPELVKKTNIERDTINTAVETILTSISKLNSHKYAWSVRCDNLEQFYKDKINCPIIIINHFRKLSELKKSLPQEPSFDNLITLDFIRLLNCEDLIDTTLRIIKKENQTANINTIIETIKRIHVEHLKNFNIPENVLDRFCKNKYVKPTRKNTSKDIHFEFEVKLDPSLAKNSKALLRLGSHKNKEKSISKAEAKTRARVRAKFTFNLD